MIQLIHCADLHLTVGDARDYALRVLGEVIEAVRRTESSYLLVCGDLFDTPRDASGLTPAVGGMFSELQDCAEVIYIPGNHDVGDEAATGFDDSPNVHVVRTRPYELVEREAIEFLCVPFAEDYAGYHEWTLPAAKSRPRVALAHGLVSGMDVYAGPEPDADDQVGVIDPDLFVRHGVVYAALGHIHGRREKTVSQTTLSYPGSTRVWRKGEAGPRGVNQVRVGDTVQLQFLPIESAGEYRYYELPVGADASVDRRAIPVDRLEANDWLELSLSGIVESEMAIVDLETQLMREFGEKSRRLDIDRDGVAHVSGILEQPLVRNFLRNWQAMEPPTRDDHSHAVWMKSRELGLNEILRAVEAHQ